MEDLDAVIVVVPVRVMEAKALEARVIPGVLEGVQLLAVVPVVDRQVQVVRIALLQPSLPCSSVVVEVEEMVVQAHKVVVEVVVEVVDHMVIHRMLGATVELAG